MISGEGGLGKKKRGVCPPYTYDGIEGSRNPLKKVNVTKQKYRLKDALGQWRDLEPRPGFEERVWRQIETVAPSPISGFGEFMRSWLFAEPAWARAAASLVGAGIGLAAIASIPHPAAAGVDREMSILRDGSVAGSYAQLVAEREGS